MHGRLAAKWHLAPHSFETCLSEVLLEIGKHLFLLLGRLGDVGTEVTIQPLQWPRTL